MEMQKVKKTIEKEIQKESKEKNEANQIKEQAERNMFNLREVLKEKDEEIKRLCKSTQKAED